MHLLFCPTWTNFENFQDFWEQETAKKPCQNLSTCRCVFLLIILAFLHQTGGWTLHLHFYKVCTKVHHLNSYQYLNVHFKFFQRENPPSLLEAFWMIGSSSQQHNACIICHICKPSQIQLKHGKLRCKNFVVTFSTPPFRVSGWELIGYSFTPVFWNIDTQKLIEMV